MQLKTNKQFYLIRFNRNYIIRANLKKDHKTIFHGLKTPNIAFFNLHENDTSTDSIQIKLYICLTLHDHKVFIKQVHWYSVHLV